MVAAAADEEVLEDLTLEEATEEVTEEATEEVLEEATEVALRLTVERTEEAEATAVELALPAVSTTLGGRVVLVASYPLDPVTTTLKSSRQPPWLVAVAASRLDPHRVHLKLVMDEGLGHQYPQTVAAVESFLVGFWLGSRSM